MSCGLVAGESFVEYSERERDTLALMRSRRRVVARVDVDGRTVLVEPVSGRFLVIGEPQPIKVVPFKEPR